LTIEIRILGHGARIEVREFDRIQPLEARPKNICVEVATQGKERVLYKKETMLG